MTIENYFERRIRPILEDNKQRVSSGQSSNEYNSANSSGYSSSGSTGYTANSGTRTNQGTALIDEDQLNRTFQEIVNCINLDDDFENLMMFPPTTDPTKSSPTSSGGNFSRSSLNFNHVHHSLLPEFNSIFGGSKSSFNVAVGSGGGGGGGGSSTVEPTGNALNSNLAALGKSFLDDDWFPAGHNGSNANNGPYASHNTSIKAGLLPSSASSSRPMTPTSTLISSSPSSRSTDFYGSSNNNNTNFMGNPPPNDYVCKLCNCEGHWMKDCRLYEPRTPPASISSFKSASSSYSNGSVGFNGANNNNNATRTLLPPGNYVCRLCNVSGHWIDHSNLSTLKASHCPEIKALSLCCPRCLDRDRPRITDPQLI